METFIQKKLPSLRSIYDFYHLPIEFYEKKPMKISSMPVVNILILTATCNGFGDVVFAYKLRTLLKKWFGNRVRVNIASNNIQMFLTIGESIKNMVYLKTRAKDSECRPLNTTKPYNAQAFHASKRLVPESIDDYDLYFVAPLVSDFSPSFKDIHTLTKNSDRFNTFFFSEYNSPLNEDILFPTGVGNDRLGLLFVDDGKTPSRKLNLKNPYSVIYIANTNVHDVKHCYLGFLEMLTHIYKLDRLDVVAPQWMMKIILNQQDDVIDVVDSHYKRIVVVNEVHKTSDIFNENPKGPTLAFRFDVLPLPFDSMKQLYANSLPHALLTGDQSITDFLNFRRNKQSVPFYQAVPWKQNFYTNMARILPQKFFKSKKTSCGNITAVSYRPNLRNFMEHNNFERNAKQLLQAVVFSAADTSETMDTFKNIVLKAGNRVSFAKQKLKEALE